MKDMMLKYSCVITGDDYLSIQNETPESKKKIKNYGIAVLIPVSIWFLNVLCLVSQVLDESFLVAIPVALFFSLIIFLIEIIVVRSSKNSWMVLFRVVLGFAVAMMGAIGLEEVAFKKDIKRQMVIINNTLCLEREQETELSFARRISQQESELNTTRQLWLQSEQDVKDEIEGKNTGSGLRGISSIANKKIQISERRRADYDKAMEVLKQLKLVCAQKIEESKTTLHDQLDNGGLLVRFKAMITLVKSDISALFFFCVFTLIFFLIEFVVIIQKSGSKTTNWDRRQLLIEEIGLRRMGKILEMDAKHFDQELVNQNLRRSQKLYDKHNVSLFN